MATVTTATDATNPSAADVQSELRYLREQNRILQSQLDSLLNSRGNTSHDNNGRERKTTFRTKASSTLEIGDNSKIMNDAEFIRSRSEGDDRADSNDSSWSQPVPPMLHHRRVSRKECNRDKPLEQHSERRPLVGRQLMKAKVSDVEFSHASNNGDYDTSTHNEAASMGGECLDQEADGEHFVDANGHSPSASDGEKTNHFSRLKIKSNGPISVSSDGRGDYTEALSVDHFSNEVGVPSFPELHIPEDDDNDDAEDSDGLIDDDSHNKHQPKSSPNSFPFPPFREAIKERAGWLIGLLFLQSCSSFIIQYNQGFLQRHMVIVQFLTMLVGAGGNAGNQASVRVIRCLAVGTLNARTMKHFLRQEAKMAFGLSALLGLTGFIRAALFRTPPGETIAITSSLCAIVAISVGLGSTLPLGMKKVGIDPAHSSTTIQVLMDILGVLITVTVSSVVLSFTVFKSDEHEGDDGDEGAMSS